MTNALIAFFRRLFHNEPPPDPQVSLSSLAMLTEEQDAELTCDQVFELLDQYTERAVRGEDVAHLMPLVKAHLDMCPDCRELYEALERLVAAV
jgi:hypothetical protein